jgi:hypothetical protein
LESGDPVEAVAEVVEQLDSIVEKFALVAEQTEHAAVKVGALRSQLAAMERRFAVMHALGLVPSLPLVRRDVDLRRLLETMIGVLRAPVWPGENGRVASSRS